MKLVTPAVLVSTGICCCFKCWSEVGLNQLSTHLFELSYSACCISQVVPSFLAFCHYCESLHTPPCCNLHDHCDSPCQLIPDCCSFPKSTNWSNLITKLLPRSELSPEDPLHILPIPCLMFDPGPESDTHWGRLTTRVPVVHCFYATHTAQGTCKVCVSCFP